jgi:hypothetical protein
MSKSAMGSRTALEKRKMFGFIIQRAKLICGIEKILIFPKNQIVNLNIFWSLKSEKSPSQELFSFCSSFSELINTACASFSEFKCG